MSNRVKVWVQKFNDRPALMLQWIDPGTGKRKSKSAGTNDPEAADQARGDLEADLNNGRYAEASRMTWERFRDLFEAEYLPGIRPATRKKYRQVLDLFEELAQPRRLVGVNERIVTAFLAGMRKRPVRGRVGMGANTIRVYLQLVHTALAYAKGQKLIAEVPNFPVVKVPKKKPQPVPTEAFEKLLDKAPSPVWRALLLTAWLAGLRAGEAYSLLWEANDEAPYLDVGRNHIILPAAFAKANEDQWVPIDPELLPVLLALPREGPKVFDLRSRAGKPLVLNTVCDRVSRMARKAGVKLSLHPLRRGFGCRYAGKVPAQVLQKLMRHANIKVTMEYYANVDEAVEEAILGPQRNSLRNSPRPPAVTSEGTNGASADANSVTDGR
jgi:integrase